MTKQKKKQLIANDSKRAERKPNRRKRPKKTVLTPKNSLKGVAKPASKQTRLVAMLQSPSGATIDNMMKATGWQQHSVRGFLAGVVRKRLQLNLSSTRIGDRRIYRVTGGVGSKSPSRSSGRNS